MNRLRIEFSWNKIAVALAIAIFFAAAYWLQGLASSGAKLVLPGGLLSFRLTANRYMAFSLPVGGPLLSALSAAIIAALAAYAAKIKNSQGWTLDYACLLLVIAAALSNLAERLRYGYVIDYFDLRYFTVFNLADAIITVGVAVLIVRILRKN